MSWTLLIGLALALGLAVIVSVFRRAELRRLEERLQEFQAAREKGTRKARLAYPHVDLSRCLGCGTCIRACPEDGVLAMIHGQALVVHGARCVGHGICALECPADAIALTIGDLDTRRDIPAIDTNLEVPEAPGLFLAGEVTGYALIRVAITQGTAIADEVARRVESQGTAPEGAYDLCIVGAGPAGLAMALQAKAKGLSFVVYEQDSLGGTVSKYPRNKLVMTQPVDLPLAGRLDRDSYSKEELIGIWEDVAAREQLPIECGVSFQGLSRDEAGLFHVETDQGITQATHVALALGRRGTPRKLEVPGEESTKVAYSLIDAQSHQDAHILVVGGGDSAVEAALALSEQPGNHVTLSYRKNAFSRIKARNETRIEEAMADGTVQVLFNSEVLRIDPENVLIRVDGPDGRQEGTIPNDQVFVMIGGKPPFELLERCGVSFDPAHRPSVDQPVERGTGLLRALSLALAMTLIGLAWITRYSTYYALPVERRPFSEEHEWLRPSSPFGLTMGIIGALLILANLAYLARRNNWFGISRGTLKAWMTFHVLTGVLSLVFGIVHGGMSKQDTLGYRALLALAVVVVTGTIGRYIYSIVPRAANGREMNIDELKAELTKMASDWDREHREFGERVRAEVQALVSRDGAQRSFWKRVSALLGRSPELRATLEDLREEGYQREIPEVQIERLLELARRVHRTAAMAANFEDLRSLIASWRYMHRWVALFLVLVLALHVIVALRYGRIT